MVVVMDLQLSCKKLCCFLCETDKRKHMRYLCLQCLFHVREIWTIKQYIQHASYEEILPQLHITLDLMET